MHQPPLKPTAHHNDLLQLNKGQLVQAVSDVSASSRTMHLRSGARRTKLLGWGIAELSVFFRR